MGDIVKQLRGIYEVMERVQGKISSKYGGTEADNAAGALLGDVRNYIDGTNAVNNELAVSGL